jgi:hypothetical protein
MLLRKEKMNTASYRDSKVASTAVRTLFLLAAFGAGVLVAVGIDMLGGWPIVMALLAGASILALMVFIRKSVVESRCYSSLSGMPPFTDIATSTNLYSLPMETSHQEGQREEREEFVPFVFKDKA